MFDWEGNETYKTCRAMIFPDSTAWAFDSSAEKTFDLLEKALDFSQTSLWDSDELGSCDVGALGFEAYDFDALDSSDFGVLRSESSSRVQKAHRVLGFRECWNFGP